MSTELKKRGSKPRQLAPEVVAEVCRLYQAGLGYRAVGKLLGLGWFQVKNALCAGGVKPRDAGCQGGNERGSDGAFYLEINVLGGRWVRWWR